MLARVVSRVVGVSDYNIVQNNGEFAFRFLFPVFLVVSSWYFRMGQFLLLCTLLGHFPGLRIPVVSSLFLVLFECMC